MNASALSELLDMVAASLWLSCAADACDRAREEGTEDVPHPGAGGDWDDIREQLGPVPSRFRKLAERLESVPLAVLSAGLDAWQRATDLPAERFAHCAAMAMLGHGVGLFDDMPSKSRHETAEERADRSAVEQLAPMLPRCGESCDTWAEWSPSLRRVI